MHKLRIIYLILAIFSILYSVVIYMVGSGTFSFVIWIAIGIFLGFLYLMEKKNLWQAVPSIVRSAFITVVIICLAIFTICQVCILSKFFSKGEPGADYIIVLGAQIRESGPSVIYKARLDSAIEYLNTNPDTKVIVTGGKGSNESISEGDGGKDYLLQQGISENRIIVENKSLDTDENIKNALGLVETTENMTIGIVTNNFHLFRGMLIAERYTDAEIMGIAAFTEYQYLPNNMVRETFGILKDL
ncbi:MAG: YdcF family protein [Butyrivibrio sp.]|nr:YdcF family protein [Butyrivibrio sp.]